MASILFRFFNHLRRKSLQRGYACDLCGAELFDYPTHRLCCDCEKKLFVSKNFCALCGREGRSEGLCLACKVLPPKFTKGFSPFVYKGEGALAVNRMKKGEPRLAAYFGEKMAEKFLAEFEERTSEPMLITAVPMTKKSQRLRGYNQAERLAESVADYFSANGLTVVLDTTLLIKTRETALQKQMTARERRENVKGAFALRERKICKDKVVLLVDDILTTGATGSECARKLFSAGAKEVYFITATAVPEKE